MASHCASPPPIGIRRSAGGFTSGGTPNWCFELGLLAGRQDSGRWEQRGDSIVGPFRRKPQGDRSPHGTPRSGILRNQGVHGILDGILTRWETADRGGPGIDGGLATVETGRVRLRARLWKATARVGPVGALLGDRARAGRPPSGTGPLASSVCHESDVPDQGLGFSGSLSSVTSAMCRSP